jgi:hypothetical protein
MNTTKYTFMLMLLSATTLLTGCSGDDDFNGNVNGNNSNAITFNTNVSNFVSKATTYDDQTALQTEGSFTCTAYNATTTTAFIEPTQVEWTGSMWQFAQNRYWPGASGLDFFAYMPATKPDYITSISYGTARQPQFVCTDMPTTAEGQKDLKEFVCAMETDKTKANSSEGVRMTFQHTFAKLLFELTNPASDGITINSITIAPSTPANVFRTGGTCTYNNTNGKWEWPSLTGEAGSIVASLNTPFLVIPNDYNATTFTITVDATYNNISKVEHVIRTATIINGEDLMIWKAGYSYTFRLTLSPDILEVSYKWTEQW